MTTPSTRALAATLAALLAAPAARAQPSSTDELALFAVDDLLSQETTVASRKAKTLRESPGVVTVVTRDEIRESGARDLHDVLRTVPGFQTGGDIGNTTGVGFRGLWGSEGKVLVLVDGVILNELLYGSAQLDAVPLDDVLRVEFVRGPGSAMYGGFAEIAVVNVLTRTGAGLSGAVTYGQMDRTSGRRSASVAVGEEREGWSVRASASAGWSLRSDGVYVDGAGASLPMGDASGSRDLFVDVGARVGGLALRALRSQWRNESRDGWGDVLPIPISQDFEATSADARYELPLGATVRLTPQLGFLRSTGWQANVPELDWIYDKTVDRYTAGLAVAWDPADGFALTAGAEGWAEEARLNEPVSAINTPFPGDKRTFEHRNAAAWAEAAWDAPFASVLVGGRFERNSKAGNSFVPRLALTRVWEPFHVKLLYAHAFRPPVIENLTSNPDIRPERTRSIEAEFGWRANERTWLALNVFETRLDDVIVYTFDATGSFGQDLYQNYARTGSRGLELDLRHQAGWGSASLAYSFYTAAGLNKVDLYAIPGEDDRLLAFAAHKVSARASVRLGRDVTVAPSLTFLSDRYGYTGVDADGELVLGHVRPQLLVDAFVSWRNAFARGLTVTAGVHDLLDLGAVYVVPYRQPSAVHGFLPGPSREWLIRLEYDR